MITITIEERKALRRELYDDTAQQLVLSYNKIRKSKLDSGLAGNAGESLLKDWITKWMPKRLSIKSGAVVSHSEGPTNQKDCLIFDGFETPVFEIEGGVETLPIEGVLGCIEMNYGNSTSYKKISHDCDKLSLLAGMALPEKKLPKKGIIMGITPISLPEFHQLDKEVQMRSLYNTTLLSPKPLLFIYAEDLNGTLKEAATRIMEHNKKAGIAQSIDGLFVLKQGVAIHRDNQGWHTQRLAGDKFSILEINEGQVLAKLQNQILHYLWLAGKTNPQGFEAYINPDGLLQETMDNAENISDEEYLTQTDEKAIRVG